MVGLSKLTRNLSKQCDPRLIRDNITLPSSYASRQLSFCNNQAASLSLAISPSLWRSKCHYGFSLSQELFAPMCHCGPIPCQPLLCFSVLQWMQDDMLHDKILPCLSQNWLIEIRAGAKDHNLQYEWSCISTEKWICSSRRWCYTERSPIF